MANLYFPRPSSSTPTSFQTAQPVPIPSTSSSSSSSAPRAPPQSLLYSAQSRAQARQLRQPKSPFVPRRNVGKEKDLSQYTIEDLEAMRDRNAVLLDDGALMASLSGGNVRIRNQQARIELRIKELEDVGELRKEMQRTTLEERSPVDIKMDGILEGLEGLHTTHTSPSAKTRIVEAAISTSPHHISLVESMQLQRLAVARDREAAAARAAQMETDSLRPTTTGHLLQKAMQNGNGNKLSDYMLQVDSDDEDEEDEDYLEHHEHDIPESHAVHPDQGQLDEEEDAQLNPYKSAYAAGYARAEAEENAREEG